MNRILLFVVFFSIFLSIYFSMNLYVYFRLTSLFEISHTLILYILIFTLAVSFPISSVLEHYFKNWFIKIFYTISAVWTGILWYLFSALLIYEILKLFIKLDPKTYGLLIIGIVVISTIFSLISASFLAVNEINLPMKIQSETKIVQLSDLHIGTIHNSGFLARVVEKTNEIDPDFVVITGDLVDGSGKFHAPSFKQLDKIKAHVYMVTGNHEFYVGIDLVMDIMDQTKVEVLRNESIIINGIQLIGVDDPGDSGKSANLSKYKITQPSILLRHQPTLLKKASAAGINLQLSGHTHAGQIFPFNLLVRTSYRYVSGLHKMNETYLYVSPGTGTWGPPMRLGSRSEITVINLKNG